MLLARACRKLATFSKLDKQGDLTAAVEQILKPQDSEFPPAAGEFNCGKQTDF